MDFKQYEDLADAAPAAVKKQVPPEEENFKSLYIAGQLREDETTGTKTTPGLLQIRGLSNNHENVNMIITHVKNVLVNEKQDELNNRQSKVVCFSYQSGPRPWYGTSGRMCGANRNERMADDFCKTCRNHIIVSGIYCDDDGNPILNNDGKPEFIFVRGKGIKFKSVSDYIYELSQLELEPFFDDDSEEARRFEKSVVNHKRFITNVSVGSTDTNYGTKFIYKFERGKQLDDKTVEKILSLSKKKLEDFNEKFDWSKTMPGGATADYGVGSSAPSKEQQFETQQSNESNNKKEPETKKDQGESQEKKQNNTVSFDDIEF